MSDKSEVNLDPDVDLTDEQRPLGEAEMADGEAGGAPDDRQGNTEPEVAAADTDAAVPASAETPSEEDVDATSSVDPQPAEGEVASEGTADEDVVDEDVAGDVEPEEDESEDDEPVAVAPAGPVELDMPEAEEISLEWYILKVQSNRERSISDALKRKVAIEGLDDYFGEILVPTEKVTEFKGGKKKIVERKLWPGYIAVQMHVNDDTWFAIRETAGIGDFTGSGGKPTPMQASEIALILRTDVEETTDAPKLDIKFSPGDKVKVKEGNFENFEGEVSGIDETHGRVTVMLSIFGRPTPVELEYWQVEGM